MSEPLKRRKVDGSRYERPPAIEDWLSKLDVVGAAKRLAMFEEGSRKSPGYVPSEVVLHYLRRAWAEGTQEDFKRLFDAIMRRVGRSLYSAIPDVSSGDAKDVRDEIMGRFAERIAEDCHGGGDLLDFFEVHFDEAFFAFRCSALRQLRPKSVDLVPLETDKGGDTEISSEVEVAASEFWGSSPENMDDPSFRSAFFSAIDDLPDDQKQVVGLLLQGFPIDSKDEGVVTIARILQCDERTVRNRRDRAFKKLKVRLAEEGAL
jgi:DNA-directed RNA polymerase specialized sigma24 family protein